MLILLALPEIRWSCATKNCQEVSMHDNLSHHVRAFQTVVVRTASDEWTLPLSLHSQSPAQVLMQWIKPGVARWSDHPAATHWMAIRLRSSHSCSDRQTRSLHQPASGASSQSEWMSPWRHAIRWMNTIAADAELKSCPPMSLNPN